MQQAAGRAEMTAAAGAGKAQQSQQVAAAGGTAEEQAGGTHGAPEPPFPLGRQRQVLGVRVVQQGQARAQTARQPRKLLGHHPLGSAGDRPQASGVL